jgi:hypothetical protein
VPVREKGNEDKIASLFEAIRAEAKLPRLKRISHRPELEQEVCTAAVTGKSFKHPAALYVTASPEATHPELEAVATSNRTDRYHPGKSFYERYSVAVWRTTDLQTGSRRYWVGIGLYGSAAGEFIDCHLTDDVLYCGSWKESIARPFRGK